MFQCLPSENKNRKSVQSMQMLIEPLLVKCKSSAKYVAMLLYVRKNNRKPKKCFIRLIFNLIDFLFNVCYSIEISSLSGSGYQ